MYKIAVLGDVHVPEHDEKAVDAALRIIHDENVAEVVLNGDIGELESVSSHGPNGVLTKDFAALRDFVGRVQKAAKGARITWCEGNHETRLWRWVESHAGNLDGVIELKRELGLDKKSIAWVPENKQPIQRGRLLILHGHQLTNNWGQKYPAQKAIDHYGQAGWTILFGHFHRAQVVTVPAYDHKRKQRGWTRGIAMGCLRTIDPKWQHGNSNGWAQQMAIAMVARDASAVWTIDFDRGHALWNGKRY